MELNNDKSIFVRITKGDRQAFDILFRNYYARLVRFAHGYLRNAGLAEEIVQDVFVRFWENAQRINIDNSVPAYLYSSVRNQSLNFIKHEKVKKKYEQGQASVLSGENDNFEEKINVEFFNKIITAAVGGLPGKCREIFEMAKFEGLTYEEIAGYLEVSVKTVENQMGIALKKLREALLPYSKQVFET